MQMSNNNINGAILIAMPEEQFYHAQYGLVALGQKGYHIQELPEDILYPQFGASLSEEESKDESHVDIEEEEADELNINYQCPTNYNNIGYAIGTQLH